jgi:hypothetical protein
MRIERFAYDEENEAKMAAHGIATGRLDQALNNRYVIRRNRAQRRAPFMFIGRDIDGDCIAAPIEETAAPGIWRPVTAWHCKPWEWSRLG